MDKGIKVLKVGNRMGSLSKHAVVQCKDKYKMLVQYGTNWVVILEGPAVLMVRQHLTSQLF